MSFTFHCQCGQEFSARPEMAGKSGKCHACGRVMIVPDRPATVAPGSSTQSTAKCTGKFDTGNRKCYRSQHFERETEFFGESANAPWTCNRYGLRTLNSGHIDFLFFTSVTNNRSFRLLLPWITHGNLGLL